MAAIASCFLILMGMAAMGDAVRCDAVSKLILSVREYIHSVRGSRPTYTNGKLP